LEHASLAVALDSFGHLSNDGYRGMHSQDTLFLIATVCGWSIWKSRLRGPRSRKTFSCQRLLQFSWSLKP